MPKTNPDDLEFKVKILESEIETEEEDDEYWLLDHEYEDDKRGAYE